MYHLKRTDKLEYWHLVLTGELENYLESMEEYTVSARESSLRLFMTVYPGPNIYDFFEGWIVHMEFLYYMAEYRAIGSVIKGEPDRTPDDIEKLTRLWELEQIGAAAGQAGIREQRAIMNSLL